MATSIRSAFSVDFVAHDIFKRIILTCKAVPAFDQVLLLDSPHFPDHQLGFLEQAGIFERDRDLAAHILHGLDTLRTEIRLPRRLDVQRADDTVTDHQRQGNFRAGIRQQRILVALCFL